ncbi:glycosyltransferase family 2 protein [uncultured Nitratireductor sp.]|uniref:glycosyltransferase family 2 protein n=1 Tax=uncultured Nitratireductor sp. TaxID=520953 RepID=UPI00261A3D7A|nr:glycosyltransferase family 2 protein [uncultured Nitratireductor sp.]
MTTYSLIVPVYKNAANIPALIDAIADISLQLESSEFEAIFVVDGSPDDSGFLIVNADKSFTAKIIFHSRNFGAFAAIRTGMEEAAGKYVAAMAADLQEPPQLILEFFRILAEDKADITFGVRTGRSDPPMKTLLSNMFWSFYRRFVIQAMPQGGVDIFGCNRKVIESILMIEEPNSSLVAQLFWVGFRRRFVPYQRRAREHGESAWSLSKRFRYMMDSIFSFSDLPIMAVLWLGIAGTLLSVAVGLVTITSWLLGYIDAPGYTTIVVLVTFVTSALLVVQGILGCYLWRALENTKRRPLRIISHIEGQNVDETFRS